MESFLVALGVVFPMLVMMASGVILRKTGMADRPLVRRVDAINFHLFLPCLLFYNIYNVDLAQDFSVEILAFAAAGLVLSLALSLLIVPRLVHRRDQVGVVVQAIVRSNFVMFGLAVTEYIYGEGNAGVAALLSAVVVPAMNVIAVLLLEYWRPEGSGRVSGKKLACGIVTNPLIIASALALVLLFLGIRLPAMVVDVVATMSRVATPLAFTMLGATLSLEGLHRNRRVLVWTCLARMVLLPAVALTAAVALGFREVELTALMVFFRRPHGGVLLHHGPADGLRRGAGGPVGGSHQRPVPGDHLPHHLPLPVHGPAVGRGLPSKSRPPLPLRSLFLAEWEKRCGFPGFIGACLDKIRGTTYNFMRIPADAVPLLFPPGHRAPGGRRAARARGQPVRNLKGD